MTPITTTDSPTFLLGDQLSFDTGVWACRGTITGKIKDADLYVITVPSLNANMIHKIVIAYGLPNRNLSLDWGKWGGYDSEFVIPANKLRYI
jgi:hypothetical protein